MSSTYSIDPWRGSPYFRRPLISRPLTSSAGSRIHIPCAGTPIIIPPERGTFTKGASRRFKSKPTTTSIRWYAKSSATHCGRSWWPAPRTGAGRASGGESQAMRIPRHYCHRGRYRAREIGPRGSMPARPRPNSIRCAPRCDGAVHLAPRSGKNELPSGSVLNIRCARVAAPETQPRPPLPRIELRPLFLTATPFLDFS